MFNEILIQQLKKNNVSKNAGKTGQRVKTLWQAATKEQKEELLALSGLGRATVQRAYTTGIISAKLVIAMAQVLEIDPYYIIGQSDVPGKWEEEKLRTLLSELKYDKLLAQYRGQNGNSRRKISRSASLEANADPENSTVQQQELLDSLTEEDMVLLLRSILLRARASDHYAQLADQIRQLLIS